MGKNNDDYNPDKERPGYGISHSNYAPVHRKSDPGGGYEKQTLPDEAIMREVGKRLSGARSVDATRITVEVSNGDVTINGAVRSEDEREQVEEAVRGTPDVASIENNLTIEPDSGSSSP
ncbi:BON domain-containing protein [Parvibaculum sp.]|uniref:BON domain-containing protein n=1 Tax=Parvibaculum sp. TaxID=2024848 RepID=UPI0027311449|nr:BON domain-containing protein [Parvibaculum sp.]MDP1628188.1 BON domain-containing protein [Parvibaculum sp.]MDP2148028.1 BON domain-containing protein [Parvibaculum sp.]MDP3326900.1 BON domain-containing protein [Parvibaculum sp.]